MPTDTGGSGFRSWSAPNCSAGPSAETTDIVQKEMYTFTDRSGDSVTLRPEATASVVRAGLSHGLFHNQQQKLWCSGPMFRHERAPEGALPPVPPDRPGGHRLRRPGSGCRDHRHVGADLGEAGSRKSAPGTQFPGNAGLPRRLPESVAGLFFRCRRCAGRREPGASAAEPASNPGQQGSPSRGIDRRGAGAELLSGRRLCSTLQAPGGAAGRCRGGVPDQPAARARPGPTIRAPYSSG